MMRRSCGSFTSLTSHSSINSQTKIFNTRDFKNYIANMEDDIIKVSNDYYHYASRYDKKINNIINRYEERTNKLFIDLRYREAECRRLNNKLEYICKEVSKIKEYTNISYYICEASDANATSKASDANATSGDANATSGDANATNATSKASDEETSGNSGNSSKTRVRYIAVIDTSDRLSKNIFVMLCIYTIFVFSMVITY